MIKPQHAGHTLATGGILLFFLFLFLPRYLFSCCSSRVSGQQAGFIYLTHGSGMPAHRHIQRETARMKGQSKEHQEVCVHGESVCLVWGSSNVNHIIYLYLWLWRLNVFFWRIGEEVHWGISHEASLWDVGHSFRHTLVNTNMTVESLYMWLCV